MSSRTAPALRKDNPLANLRRWMAEQSLDAAYVTRPVSIAYLTGFHAEPHERLMALAVQSEGATLVVPALEQERAATNRDQAVVLAWRDGENPYAAVREALGRHARLGVEKEHLTVKAAEDLAEAVGARELVDVAPEIRRLRRIKSPAELEKMARACAITDSVAEEVMQTMLPGQSELELAMRVGAAISARGAAPSFETSVQSGANSAIPHHDPGGRRLEAGDLVLFDFGAAFEGYRGDLTRMAVVGAPTARQREIYALVLRAHDAAIEAVRPGVTTGQVDAAAREVIEAGGFGAAFFHRVGHGLGLEVHEDPSLDPASDTALEPGMVFTIEPGIYLPGWGGIRIEDDLVVESAGCRVLTRADRSLRAVGAS
ncbi:MAG TPA: Xaa-Pro peptidase family protein [Candidatus Dormibacteraeota bacterium]|nr:Xaa-Pro peptidase family protein [Candidatus Dormibacteraeota bacterium]